MEREIFDVVATPCSLWTDTRPTLDFHCGGDRDLLPNENLIPNHSLTVTMLYTSCAKASVFHKSHTETVPCDTVRSEKVLEYGSG